MAPTSFDLRAREILGIAGLVGSGRTELLHLIFGADRAEQGDVFLGDQTQAVNIHSPKQAIATGIAMITEDPQKPGPAAVADDYIQRLRIRSRDCPIMLFDESTRGIDINAKFDIYKLMAALSHQGKGLLIVSCDLRELMLICDRIAVMSAGKLVDTLSAASGARKRFWLQPSAAVGTDNRSMTTPTSSPIMTTPSPSFSARMGMSGLKNYLGLLAMCVLFSFLSEKFLTLGTFSTLSNAIPTLVVMAVGMTFVLIVGGIDLSVGSVMALATSIL